MLWKKIKKTLTISSNLTKKIDLSTVKKDGKKSFSIGKKKPFKGTRDFQKQSKSFSNNNFPVKKF